MRQIAGPGGTGDAEAATPPVDENRRVVQHGGEVLLLGFHEEPEKSATVIRSKNHLLPDKSGNRIITPGPLVAAVKDEGFKMNGTADGGGSTDYLTGDVKFIISILLGCLGIVVLVYIILRVSVK